MYLGVSVWCSHYWLFTQAPPHVPSPLPWLGNIVAFGEKPIDFLLGSYKQVEALLHRGCCLLPAAC